MFLKSAVFLTILSVVFGADCPDVSKGVKKYLVYEERENWFSALFHCSSQGMSLATIESQEDHDKIKALLDPECPKDSCGKQWWIGGSDLQEEGEYLWFSTGQPMEYKNFAPGEPNNVKYWTGEGENCIHINGGSSWDYQWNDSACEHLHYFICEYFE